MKLIPPSVKDAKIPSDFWENVEKDLKYVLYSDTDSIFIRLLDEINDPSEYQDLAINTGIEINDYMKPFNDRILQKCNVDYTKYNMMDFKTETAIRGMLLLKKKMYFYLKVFELTKKGPKIYDPKKGITMGLPFKKGDTAKYIKEFGKLILEFPMNDENYDNFRENLNDLVMSIKHKYEEALSNFDFNYIGKPQKNASNPSVLTSSRLYNSLFGDEVITKGQSVLRAPIIIKKKSKLQNIPNTFLLNSDFNKLKYISVPYNYDSEEIRAKFEEYEITLHNEFVASEGERQPRVFYTQNNVKNPTPVKRIIDAIQYDYKVNMNH